MINIAALRQRLAAKAPNSGGTLEPNEYALQMLRFPYRQVFGDPKDTEGKKFYALDRFKATVALDTWKSTVVTKLGRCDMSTTPFGLPTTPFGLISVSPSPAAWHCAIAARSTCHGLRQAQSPAQGERLFGALTVARSRGGATDMSTKPRAPSTPPPCSRCCAASVFSPPTAPRSTSARSPPGTSSAARAPPAVPIDVQALYVAPGSTEKMVRLPMLVAHVDGANSVQNIEDGLPDPFDEGAPREAGVHLHWAMPGCAAARLAEVGGRRQRQPPAPPPLPDRWLVLRLCRRAAPPSRCSPAGCWRPTAPWPCRWRSGRKAARPRPPAQPAGDEIRREQLTGTVGGAVSWSGVYDAVLNRFAFHDPLAELKTIAPQGVDEDCASYLVAGWWSDPALDPLDKARSNDSLHEMLERLRWRLLYEWGDET